MKDLNNFILEKRNDYGYDDNKLEKLMEKIINIIKEDDAPNYPEVKSFYDVMNLLFNYFEDDFTKVLKEYFKTHNTNISFSKVNKDYPAFTDKDYFSSQS